MSDFELGQVFQGSIAGELVTLVVINIEGDKATLAIAPDRDRQLILTQADLVGWKRVQASDSDWYLEGVLPSGNLFWNLFIPGFEAAWAFFSAQLGDISKVGGYIRIGASEEASDSEVFSFEDAGGVGPERFVGFSPAVERLSR